VIIFNRTSNFEVAITKKYLHGICRANYGNHCSRLLHVLVERQEMLRKFFLIVPFIIIKVHNTPEYLLFVLNDTPKPTPCFHFR